MQSVGKISLEKKRQNKVYFNYDDDEPRRDQLFSDNSEDETECNDNSNDFRVKKQFEGAKGQKLLELQTTYQKDSRFNLDERFYESDEEEDDDKAEDEKGDNDTEEIPIEEEVSKQLQILQNIVGPEVRITGEKKERKDKSYIVDKVRFDPTIPEHEKFVVKPREKSLDKQKVKAKKEKKKELDENDNKEKRVQKPKKPEVSKETFYEVADDLKARFTSAQGTSTGFSFSQMFQPSNHEAEEDNLNETSPEKKDELRSSKPLNKRSLQDIEDKSFGGDLYADGKSKETKLQGKNSGSLWKENFFYRKNDPRFEEVAQFFSMKDFLMETKNFSVKRDQLRKIVKKKLQHDIQNKPMFKNKVKSVKGNLKKNLKKRKFGQKLGSRKKT